MTKKSNLSERDIVTQFIMPAILKSGWKLETQVREEVYFTDGRIFVKGNKTLRGERKYADIILYYKPNIPVAIIEAKKNSHPLGTGMQQVLKYAEILDIPVVYSSNGDAFLEHDKGATDEIERTIDLEHFPTPDEVWKKYKKYKGIETETQGNIAAFDYFFDGSGRTPRYYQQIAINRTVESIAKGQNRILLVMATGTGKTYTAFQIIYRLWKAGVKKRILFLADRNALLDQTKRGDFKHFNDGQERMTVVRKKIIDKAYEIYLALYQGLTNYDDDADADTSKDAYKQFSSGFFDLVVIDECHRGSAAEDSAWRNILEYFKSATHIGLTATPKETDNISNIEYFGDPVYTYSLKQGIDDGFLAPYKVLRIGMNIDLEGWRPDLEVRDSCGAPVEDRIYNMKDYDRNLVIDERTKRVAYRVIDFLQKTNPYDKTIVFCVDIEHAERMRQALINASPVESRRSSKYVMRITGDDNEGKRELDNFINPEEPYPVIAVTSKLMTTGVDAQTCKLIVLDSNINSMTEFKQIIGRGTRINEEYGKQFFTIMDFRNVTNLFADPDFDGDPVQIKTIQAGDDGEADYENEDEEREVFDPVSGKKIDFGQDIPDDIISGGEIYEKHGKVYVSGIDVSILNERAQYLDENGKLIVESLKEYTKRGILRNYRSMDEFLAKWNDADKKSVIIEELEKHGVFFENFMDDIQRDNSNLANVDIFDLICHIAWDKKPLSRAERAAQVKKRNCFAKYEEKARKVIDALLDKYASEGIVNIEELSILKVDPLNNFGTPQEIIGVFGGKENYLNAVRELEKEIYRSDNNREAA